MKAKTLTKILNESKTMQASRAAAAKAREILDLVLPELANLGLCSTSIPVAYGENRDLFPYKDPTGQVEALCRFPENHGFPNANAKYVRMLLIKGLVEDGFIIHHDECWNFNIIEWDPLPEDED